MGARYSFACSSCRYVAGVSGGPDMGKFVQTETMVCRRCHQVVDVVVESRTPRTFPVQWTQKVAQCPKCGSTEWLQPWQNRNCPKCGREMKQGDRLMFWD